MRKQLFLIVAALMIVCVGKAQLQSIMIDAETGGICSGDSLELVVNLEIGGLPELRFEWSPNIGISDTTSDRPKVSPSATTTYFVTVYDEDNNISKSDSFVVNVVPVPQVVAPADDSVCIDKTYQLTPEQFGNADNLQWTILSGDGYFQDTEDDTSNKQSTVFVPDSAFSGIASIQLRGSGTDYCSDVFDTINLEYLDGGIAADIITDSMLVCSTDTIFLSAQAQNYQSFSWTHNGRGTLLSENTLNPIYVPVRREFGELNISLQADGTFCSAKDSVNFLLSEVALDRIPDFDACNGELLNLGYTPSQDLTFNWNTGSTNNSINVQAIVDDEFMVYVFNDDGCEFRDTMRMTVHPVPQIDVSYDYDDNRMTVSPDNLARYIFKTGQQSEVLQDGIDNSYMYEELIGQYDSIYIEAYNDYCPDYETFGLPYFKKVNVFSPNGDGINDLLMPGRRITVFDRTHKILYEGWDGWDGTFNGEAMPQATYFYILYTNEGNIYYKGPVTILRD